MSDHPQPLQTGHAASYPATDAVRDLVRKTADWHEGWEHYEMLATHLDNVRQFTTTFGQPAPDKPTVPSPELAALRHKLLSEESAELVAAKTLTDCLDAVCDQLYVTLGNAVACGFTAEQINRGLAEVHRSNMTKVWTREEFESDERIFGIVGKVIEPGKYVVKNNDGKILKPPGYSPADLSWVESTVDQSPELR